LPGTAKIRLLLLILLHILNLAPREERGSIAYCLMARAKPILRNGIYYLRKRVPERFKSIEPRAYVWVSLKTDSRTEANAKAAQVWEELTVAWEARKKATKLGLRTA
jgi:hypothetical protein